MLRTGRAGVVGPRGGIMYDRRAFLAGTLALTLAGRAAAQPAGDDAWTAGANAILARIQPPVFPKASFTITDFGAIDGQPAHLAVQAAIDACAAAGGGRVVVPPGLWPMNGAVHLRSNIDFHVQGGATLRFGRPGEIDLPIVLTRWEGIEVYNYSPLIYAHDCTNVAITGEGTFDGQGRDGFFKWRERQNDDKRALREMGAKGVPVEKRQFGPGHYLRPAFVEFFECRNVLVDGPRFYDSPFWTIHPVYSSNVTVRNIVVVSKHLNSDGVDPDSCEDVLIERCRITVSDDCIAIKSGRDQDGWRVGRPTRNVVIRDCRMSTDVAGAVAIGSEMSGGASNIYVDKLRIHRAQQAIYIKANLERGGTVEKVHVRNVKVSSSDTLIKLTTAYHGGKGGKAPPTYKGFIVEKVDCVSTGQVLNIVGVPQAPVQDVLIRGVTVGMTMAPNIIEHTKGLRIEEMVVRGVVPFGSAII